MKQYDKNTVEEIGIPALVLMERAALAVFEAMRERGFVREESNILILAGYGNNGGDALALARLLAEAGVWAEVWMVGDCQKATDAWKRQRDILRHYPVTYCKKPSQRTYTVIVDGLFGVGLSRPIAGEHAAAIELLNELKGYKIALDLPSGVDSDGGRLLGSVFRADLTVTFGFEKRGLYLYPACEYAGEILLADIGISERSFLGSEPKMFVLDQAFSELLPERKQNGNKGTFGKALIIAGSYQMAGAALLCARACYGTGAGMVKVLTCRENREIIQEQLPEALLGSYEDLESGIDWCDVICIGPGIGQSKEAQEALDKVLKQTEKPLVLDADALNLLAKNPEWKEILGGQGKAGRSVVLTPHLGELKRLYDGLLAGKSAGAAQDPRGLFEKPWLYAEELAGELHGVVAAKDARTFVCDPEGHICLNVCGNSGMATAGSGDVLSGILTAFLCQGVSSFEGACRAVRLHALAGDAAALACGEHGLMAGDLIRMLRGGYMNGDGGVGGEA